MSTYNDILDLYLGGYSSAEAEINQHLDFVTDVDLSEPDYSFHLLRLYVRRHDGMILWSTDAGCSCPSPFESTRVSDLHESTLTTFTDAAMKAANDENASNPVAEIRHDIAEALAEAKKRGAR